MRNIQVTFTGVPNFGGVERELAKIQAQMATLQAYSEKIAQPKGGQLVNPEGYRRSINLMQAMRKEFGDAVASSGQFNVEQHHAISATEDLSRKVQKTQASFSDMFKGGRKGFREMATDIAKQQMLLERSMVKSYGTDAQGRHIADVVTPKTLGDLDDFNTKTELANTRLAAMGQMIKSGSIQLTNWGKNLQWTGRQMAMTFTLPTLAFGAVAGKLAYDADQQLTRIAKVYDGTNKQIAHTQAASMETAQQAAEAYGSSLTDTLNVTAELAAVGLKGSELQEGTNEVVRLATLGEMEHATALDATIAMQNIFKQSTKETAEAIDYMNAVENETSLSMEDFATAIPIAAKPVQAMGGDLQDLGVLLVAMKSQGIQAAEGANAIKGAVGRLLAPSKEAKELWKNITGQDYQGMVDKTGGDAIQMFREIDKATKNLNRQDRAKIFDKLFGKYQLTRMTAMMDGLRGINDETSQVGRAMAKAGQISENRASAEEELSKQMESSSGKIKRAWEELKATLATFGDPFLEIGAAVLNVISGVLQLFNKLPGPVKMLTAIGVGMLALLGPIFVLVGAMAQVVGAVGRGVAMYAAFRSGVKLASKEETIATAIRKAATEAIMIESRQVANLAQQYNILAAANQRAANVAMAEATAAGQPIPAQFMPQMYGQTSNMSLYHSKSPAPAQSSLTPLLSPVAATNMQKVADSADEAGKATGRMSGNMKTNMAFAGTAAASFVMMESSSGSIAGEIAKWVMYGSLAMPLLSGIKAVDVRGFVGGWTNLRGAIGGATGAVGKMKAGAGSLWTTLRGVVSTGGMIGGAVAVALVAGGLLLKKFNDDIDETTDKIKQLNNTGQNAAAVFGYQYKAPESKIKLPTIAFDEKTPLTQLDKIQKEYSGVIEQMGEMGEEEKVSTAISIALDARRTGASAKQAARLARSLIEQSTTDIVEKRKLIAQIPLEINLDTNLESLQFTDLKNRFASMVSEAGDIGAKETVKNMFTPSSHDEISDAAEQSAKDLGSDIYDAYAKIPTQQGKIKFIEQFDQDLKDQWNSMVDGFSQEGVDKLRKAGYDIYDRADAARLMEDPEKIEDIAPELRGNIDAMRRMLTATKLTSQEFGKQAGLSEDMRENIIRLDTALYKGDGIITQRKGTELWGKVIGDVAHGLGTVLDTEDDISKKQQLIYLNDIRRAMGLKETGTLQDGLNEKVTVPPKEIKKAADETKKAADETENLGNKWDKLISQLGGKSAFADWFSQEVISSLNDSMSEIGDEFSSAFDEKMEASMSNLEDNQEAVMDAFDAQRERGAAKLDREMERYQAKRERGLEDLQEKQEQYEARRAKGLASIERDIEQYERQRQKGLDKITQRIQDLDKLQEKFDNRMARREENINERFDDEISQLDRRRSALEDQQRIIDKQMEKEQKAEEQRQKNFEKEMSRIQRLAEAQNRQIDFSSALASGNLDEAAKIKNDAFASQQLSLLERAAAASQAKSDRKVGALEGESGTLDDRIHAIDREVEALERARKRALANFEKIKKRQQQLLNQQIKTQRKLLMEERQQYREETKLGLRRLQREKRNYERETQMGINALEREQERYQRRTELHQKFLERQKEKYDKETELQREALEKQQEEARESAQKRWETRKKFLDKEMEAILAFTPKSMKEARKQVNQIEKLYGKYGIKLEKSGDQWARSIRNSLEHDLNAARHNMAAESKWKQFGKKIAEGTLSAFGISLADFKKWGKTGKAPKDFSFEDIGASGSTPYSGNNDFKRHKGGPIGGGSGFDKYNSRAGYAGGQSQREVNVLAEKGEWMINKGARNHYGDDFMSAVNNRTYNPGTDSPTDLMRANRQNRKLEKKVARGRGKGTGGAGMGAIGGALGPLAGMTGMLALGVLGKLVTSKSIDKMITSSIMANMGLGAAKPGVYGDDGMFFDREQLRNAYIIAQVGEQMNMGARNIQIGLMTAMVESGLRNVHYGDRDSQGLFQQRPSQGWGTVAQVTDPYYAARKFFSTLRGVDPKSMSMGDAAQAVQRSAFPGRYQEMRDEAQDIYAAMMAAGGGTYGGMLGGPGSGGWHKPLKHISWTNSHDLSAGIGTPAYAVNDGKIVESRMITSGTVGSGNVVPGAASYGITTLLRLPGGVDVRYAHGDAPWQKNTLPVGSQVKGGAHIFNTGSSGNVTGAHLHMDINGDYNAQGWLGARVPGMATGGYTLNTGLAELHPKETVLTAPLSAQLERGIARLDKTGGSQYNDNSSINISIENHGDMGNEFDRQQLAKEIRKELAYQASRTGKPMRIGDR